MVRGFAISFPFCAGGGDSVALLSRGASEGGHTQVYSKNSCLSLSLIFLPSSPTRAGTSAVGHRPAWGIRLRAGTGELCISLQNTLLPVLISTAGWGLFSRLNAAYFLSDHVLPRAKLPRLAKVSRLFPWI